MNDSVPLYNFYRRYLWNETDFGNWQDGMVQEARGVLEGLVAAAVLSGYDVAPSGATLACTVQPGIASAPSGYMGVVNSVSLASMQTADGTNPRRDLIVLRPVLTANTQIARPTAPFDPVYLRTLQQAAVVVISGTAAASPVYPSTQANDVVLAGVRVAASVTSLAQTDIDYSVRDTPGKNSRFQEAQAKYDRRLRPYLSTSQVLGIKPSQLFEGNNWRSFVYISPSTASRYPQDGAGNIQNIDATLNFQSGVVAGGDALSPDFSPTIPTANNCIVATVAIDTSDNVHVTYGTVGTRAQCFAAIYNQTQAGAGAIAAPPTTMFVVAFVVVSSKDGSNVTELDLVDARTPFAFSGAAAVRRYPNVLLAGDGSGDYTTLAAAIAALPTGGVICVSANTTVPTNATLPNNTKLLGRKNVTLTVSAGATVTLGDNCLVEDLTVDHTGATSGNALLISGNNAEVFDCIFKESAANTGVAISVTGNYATITDSRFYGVLTPSTGTGISVGNNAVDCYANNNTYLT